MAERRVYLDHATTTPLLAEAREAMLPFLTEDFASAGSMHSGGLRVRDAIGQARAQIAQLINATSPEEIIFTSSGTESANLAIKGVAEANRRRGSHIVTSVIEHPAVLRSVEFLESQGFECTRVEVDGLGGISPEKVLAAVSDKTILIALHHANYDLGTIQPIAELGKVAAERGIPLFIDGSSSGGWLNIDVQAMNIGLLSLAPHRFYGPKGAGVLYRNRRVRLSPIIHGGIQEDGRRAGTENVAAMVGAGVAAEYAAKERKARVEHVSKVQAELWTGLEGRVPHLRLNGPNPGPRRISNQLNVSFEFVEGEGVMLMLDTRGVAVASGTACVSKSIKPSAVLHAIGLPESLAQGAVIFSPGKDTTTEEIQYSIEACASVVQRLRSMSPAWDEFRRGVIQAETAPGG